MRWTLVAALTSCLGETAGHAQQVMIKTLSPDGALVWSNAVSGKVSIIEQAPSLDSTNWVPYFYDSGSAGDKTTTLPGFSGNQGFLRLHVRTNVPDASLLLHVPFDNYFSNGVVLDVSGNQRNGYRFGRICCPTNWPSAISGPDGSQAAEFHWYADGYAEFGKSGDYVGVTNINAFMALPQATISCWAHYYADPTGDWRRDYNATLISAGYSRVGAWNLGRTYSPNTTFTVTTSAAGPTAQNLGFPDISDASVGDSGGWHHYAVSFSNGLVQAYFDGTNCASKIMGVTNLSVGYYSWAPWIGFGCSTHDGTPWLDDEYNDGSVLNDYPNNGWLNGAMDDVRIYNRVLSPDEVLGLYSSFDHLPPSSPTNLSARAAASTQVEVRWNLSTDNFRVAGYRVLRDSKVVGVANGRLFCDTGLKPGTTYQYSVECFDIQGNSSPPSAPVSVTTGSDAGVEVIVDNADGIPYLIKSGTWSYVTASPGLFGIDSALDNKGDVGKALTYTPVIPEAGDYDVYIRYPGSLNVFPFSYSMDKAVPVQIVTGGVTNSLSVNEQTNYGTWYLLGNYHFDAGTNGTVQILTTGTTGYVLGDAFRFVK